MKYIYLAILFMMGCANRVEVPSTVTTTQCIQDSQGKCTANFEVRHVIAIELPTVLTDSCKATWNEHDFPDKQIRDAGYNRCVADYIQSILDLVKGINPSDLPPNITLPQ